MRSTLISVIFLLLILTWYSGIYGQCTVKLAGKQCAGSTVLAYMAEADITTLTWFYEDQQVFTQPLPFSQDGRKLVSGNGLNGITGIVAEGSSIYVNDWYNHRILKFTAGSTVGRVVAIAREGKYDIYDFCVYNDTVYLAENYNIRYPGDTPYYITKWVPGAGYGVPVAGMGTNITLYREVKTIAVDANGTLYAGDTHGSGLGRVFRFRPGSGTMKVVLGGFTYTNTWLRKNFDDLQVDKSGAIYLLFRDSGFIRKWQPGGDSAGTVVARLTPVAPQHSFYSRNDFFITSDNTIYCTENNDPGPFGRIIGSQCIMRYEPGSSTGTMVLGDDGRHFSSLSGICLDKDGNILAADFELNTVQQFVPASGKMFTRYTPTAAGNYRLAVTADNGCGTNLDFMVAPQTAQPYINGPRYVCPGETGVTFSIANPQPGTLYKWYIEPESCEIVSGQGTNTIKVNWGNASYGIIKVTAYSNCGPSKQATALVSCTEYSRTPFAGSGGLQVTPNPVSGIASVQWTAISAGLYHMVVADLTGNICFSRKVFIPAKGKCSISPDLGQLRRGMYLLRITGPAGQTLQAPVFRQ